jgi:hypothetical protein
MSTTLYQDAIVEAKQLQEMAEQNAKNQIIEAITTRLRKMIDSQLIGEGDDIGEDEEDAIESLLPDEEEGAEEAAILDLSSLAQGLGGEIEVGVEDENLTNITVSPTADADIEVDENSVDIDAGSVNIHIGSKEGDEEEEMILSMESVQALVDLIHGSDDKKRVDEAIRVAKHARRKVKRFDSILEAAERYITNPSQRKMVCKYYKALLKEAISLRDEVILTEGEEKFNILQLQVHELLKEIRKMSRRRNEILKRLLEADEEKNEKQELDELDAILTLEPADEDEATEVEDLLADLEIEVNLEEPVETAEVDAEEEVEVDVGEVEDEEVEIEEAVYEIDESMLRRELRRMRRLREQEESDAVDASPASGGLDGEVVEVDDEDLLNALADELGDPAVPEPAVESRRHARARKINESRKTRALQHKLVEYKKAVASLRNQLIEMNLFNAKLLYANKLMQNRNVTPKQQRAIVEALDNATTLREAKLLYKSLTASLTKRSQKTLTEGRIAKTLGSSSRSTRSASPANSGHEVDRWAVLAGIANKDN